MGIIILLALLLIPNMTYAACSGSSPTRTAANASKAEVDLCVAAAASGDKIVVPAGTYTWSSAVDIPVTKDLWISGAGIGNTVLTCSSGWCFTIAHDQNGSGSSASRISGFTMNNGAVNLEGLSGNKIFIVDHNRIVMSSWFDWHTRSKNTNPIVHPTGVIANNELVNIRIYVAPSYYSTTEDLSRPYQHQLWAQDTPWGDFSHVVYVETNTFTVTGGYVPSIDSNWGGRYVFRFNTIIGAGYIEEHAIIGDNHRGNQRWEIYNNNLRQATDGHGLTLIQGSGSGVIFNNLAPNQGAINIGQRRSSVNVGGTAGKCNGSNTNGWDGNFSGQQGYPCRDQIGRVQDPVQWANGNAYVEQVFKPAYMWNNPKASFAQATISYADYVGTSGYTLPDLSSVHIQENRDYFAHSTATGSPQTVGVRMGTLANRPAGCTTGVAYWATDQGNWNQIGSGGQGVLYKCTATNTWSLYYTPYTYPHPFVAGSTSEKTLNYPGIINAQ